MTNTRNIKYCKAFGENLRKLRKKKGFTMMDLAFAANIEYSQIARIERGLSNPTVSTVFMLSTALELKPIELFRFNFFYE